MSFGLLTCHIIMLTSNYDTKKMGFAEFNVNAILMNYPD